MEKTEKSIISKPTPRSITKKKPLAKPAPVEKKFEKDDLISCTSVFPGSCILIGKRTGNQYVWDAMGEEQFVVYQDLQAEILNKRSSFIYDPLIVINDPEVYKGREAIAELYKSIYFIEDIQGLMESGDTVKIKKVLREMPSGVIKSVKTIISTLIQDGVLTNYKSVKAVDDELGTEIAKQFELFG